MKTKPSRCNIKVGDVAGVRLQDRFVRARPRPVHDGVARGPVPGAD